MIPRPRRASFLPSASQTSEGADYRVPLISVPDILGFCAQMDLDLAQEDLVAPTSARIQLNLMALIEIFLPWRFEMMEHEVAKALDRFDNAELAEEAEVFIIFEEIKVFLDIIRYSDFEIQDILKPKPLRTQKMFSAIVNFALHRNSCWTFVSELSNDGNDLNKQKQELAEAIEGLEDALNKTRATNEAEAVEIDAYNQKNQVAEDNLRHLRKEAERLGKIYDEHRTEKRGLREVLQEVNFLMLNVAEEVKAGELLRDMDYQALVKEYNEMKTTVDSLANESSLVTNSIAQVEQLLSAYKCIDKFFSRCIQLANNLDTFKADMTRQQKTNAAILHELHTKDATSVKKGQTHLSNLKVTAQLIESRKKNMQEQKKMTKEREVESWKHLKEQEETSKKDILGFESEKNECLEKMKQVNMQADALQQQSELETKKLINTIFGRLCHETIEAFYTLSEQEKRRIK